MAPWTTPQDVEARVRRRWDDGDLLRAHAGRGTFEPIRVALRGPRPSEIGDDLVAVREWIARLDEGRRGDRQYALEWRPVGGRHIGRNEIPTHAVVHTLDQAWRLLGVRPAVEQYDEVLAVAGAAPAVHAWVVAHPHRAIELRGVMGQLVAAYRWLDTHRGSGHYLREITAPGVDTKFAEAHRGVLAAMLDVPPSPSGFLSGLGLRAKPDLVRIRPAPSLGLPAPLTELAVRSAELAELSITPRTAIVVENEITYLSLDVPEGGVVIWGKGFEIDRVGRLPWLTGVDIVYWGDIDSHGFAILDRLRAWLPQTRSVLMDAETLLAHRERWVIEDRPARSVLTRLSPSELDLYADLVSDRLGDRVRLEQERVDWKWAATALRDVTG